MTARPHGVGAGVRYLAAVGLRPRRTAGWRRREPAAIPRRARSRSTCSPNTFEQFWDRPTRPSQFSSALVCGGSPPELLPRRRRPLRRARRGEPRAGAVPWTAVLAARARSRRSAPPRVLRPRARVQPRQGPTARGARRAKASSSSAAAGRDPPRPPSLAPPRVDNIAPPVTFVHASPSPSASSRPALCARCASTAASRR